MKILICGVGAIGSNLVRYLVPDLKGQHEITVLDMDTVEERNVTPGTQWYTPDQIGLPKVEAVQFNAYNTFQREIEIRNEKFTKDLTIHDYSLVVDCFDNQEARQAIESALHMDKVMRWGDTRVLHIGFSDQFTFEIEWDEWYQVPTDITTGMDICEMPGAAGFVGSVASLGALAVEKYIWENDKIRVLGGKYHRSFIT